MSRSKVHTNLVRQACSSTRTRETTASSPWRMVMIHTRMAPRVILPPYNVVPCNTFLCILVGHTFDFLFFILIYHAGDPTTPGYPAYENATRAEPESIPKIPSLPISWANAQRLLAEISSGDARKLTGKASKSTIRLVNHGTRIHSSSDMSATPTVM